MLLGGANHGLNVRERDKTRVRHCCRHGDEVNEGETEVRTVDVVRVGQTPANLGLSSQRQKGHRLRTYRADSLDYGERSFTGPLELLIAFTELSEVVPDCGTGEENRRSGEHDGVVKVQAKDPVLVSM